MSSGGRWSSRSKAAEVLSWDGQVAHSNSLPSKALTGAVLGSGEGGWLCCSPLLTCSAAFPCRRLAPPWWEMNTRIPA